MWRKPVMQRIKQVCANAATPLGGLSATCDELDVYEFGVYTGRAMRGMSHYLNDTADKDARHEAWKRSNHSLEEYKRYTAADVTKIKASHHGCCRRFWGFDSFQGLPPDAPAASNRTGRGATSYSSMVGAAGAFGPQSFSVAALLKLTSQEAMMVRLDRYLRDTRFKWIPGFFNESLTPGLAQERGMRPALYVDIDVDIYISSYQALDWLCKHKLIRRGTIIGYDDWLWGLPGFKAHHGASTVPGPAKDGINTRRLSSLDGEARAHEEVLVAKYGLKFKQLHDAAGQGGSAFIVTKVPW